MHASTPTASGLQDPALRLGPASLSRPRRVTHALRAPEEGAGFLRSLQKASRRRGPTPAQGAPRGSAAPAPNGGGGDGGGTQLRPEGTGAGGPRGCLRAPPRVLARPPARCAAASRGGRQHGACALARSRPGPWALPGGREVGTWAGAGPHTLPARRRRRRHLAARAPRDARRMSGAGKRAGAAPDPVGGSPPSRSPPEATGQQS